MKFSIRDLFLVTVIVALATGWFLDRQKLAKLTENLGKLAEENKQLRIDADLHTIDLAVQSRTLEQYKRPEFAQGLETLNVAQAVSP